MLFTRHTPSGFWVVEMEKPSQFATRVTRRLILAQAGALTLVSLPARAEEAGRVFRIGVLTPSSRAQPNYDGLFDELRTLGFAEGKNLVVDERGFSGRFSQFPELAVELVKAKVDVILCGGDAAIRGAQQATSAIPIIGVTDDFIGAGLIKSLAHPGANTTGISMLSSELDGKRQEVLIDLVPGLRHMAALVDPNTTLPRQLQILQDAARYRRIDLSIHNVAGPDDVVRAVAEAKASGAEALNVLASPLFNITRNTVIAQTIALRLPAMHHTPEMAAEGGLAAYGPRFSEVGRMQARLLVKVLRGAKPAELPVEQPTKIELAINLKTAKAMGLEVPGTLLALADQVIE
jgi:putative ABC transport system substrate-binding protein